MYIEQFLPRHTKEHLNNNSLVIATEGLPGAGKSTTLREILKNYPKAQIIPEFTRFTEIPRDYPPISIEESKYNFNKFIGAERMRRNKLASLQAESPSGNILFLDRTFLGLLAYEYATRSQTGVDLFSWAMREVYRIRDQLIIPDHIFFLDIDVEVARMRAENDTEHTRRRHYYQNDFSVKHREFYRMLAKRSPAHITFLSAEEPTGKIVHNMTSVINSYTGYT